MSNTQGQIMKKLAAIFFSAILLSHITFADEDKVVATCNDSDIKESQVIAHFKFALDMQPKTKGKKFAELAPYIQEELVSRYIKTRLLNQEVKNSGIETSKEFQEKLSNVKAEILQQEVLDKYTESMVTDKLIEADYNSQAAIKKGQAEVKISHILVTGEKTAKDIKKKLSKGGKFDELVKEFSQDKETKADNGVIGYITKGSVIPAFENLEIKALSLKVNEISDPIKTPSGWHIIKVLDKRPAQMPPLERLRDSIVERLTREFEKKYIDGLIKQANVKLKLATKGAGSAGAINIVPGPTN